MCACAEALPFQDETFDAALAVLTVHHWVNLERGLDELRRTSRQRVVILTFDPSVTGFWLTDYFPEIADLDRRILPSLPKIQSHFDRTSVHDVPVPYDCTDGFLGAYWRRPEAYLRSEVRAAISSFSRISNVAQGLSELRRDLDSGEWLHRYGRLLHRDTLDVGYRLIVAH